MNIVNNTLINMGAKQFLGNGLAFINIPPELLDSDLLDRLPSAPTIRETADFIKLDIQRFDTKTLAKAISHYRHYPLKLIAKKVETMKEYLACVELGFDYFQGYHFTLPETLS